jgi:hypothetical protein
MLDKTHTMTTEYRRLRSLGCTAIHAFTMARSRARYLQTHRPLPTRWASWED